MITRDGFEKKTLQELKAEYEVLFRASFGETVDLDPRGPIGQIIGVLSKRDADMWELAQDIYDKRDPRAATGDALDMIAKETGVVRLGATATSAQLILLGEDGTTVPAGSMVRRKGGIDYKLLEAVEIDEAQAVEVWLELETPEEDKNYSVQVDGVTHSYQALFGDTKRDVAEGLFSDGLQGLWEDGLIVRKGWKPFALGELEGVSVEYIGGMGRVECVEVGRKVVGAGVLTEIVTPVSGWLACYNPLPADTGREVETDEELRIRRERTMGTGNATEEALHYNLLNRVHGISDIAVVSNRTMSVSPDGQPPKSFEVIVSGGELQDIAQVIWETQPAGIASWGNINADGTTEALLGSGVEVLSSWGDPQTIHFSRPVPFYLWIRIKRALYNEEAFPPTGDQMIRNAILQWAGGEYTMGKDVIRQRLLAPVYSVPGVGEVEVSVDASLDLVHSPVWKNENISVAPRQHIIVAVERIIVEEL